MSQNQKYVSNDSLINNMTKILVNVSEEKGYKFSLRNKTLQPQFIFSYCAMLPIFMLEAKEIYEKIFNKKFTAQELLNTVNLKKNPTSEPGPEIPKELVARDLEAVEKLPVEQSFPMQVFVTNPDETFFGFEPRMEHLKENNPNFNFGLMASCAIHGLEEYVKHYEKNPSLKVDGTIPLEPFCQKWFNKLEKNKDYMPLYNAQVIQDIDARKQQKNTSTTG